MIEVEALTKAVRGHPGSGRGFPHRRRGPVRLLEPVPEGHRVIEPSAWPLGEGTRHRKVEDVMTASVVTADRLTPYKEVARLLAEHRISGMPVLRAGWQVVGVVSEADLLAAQDQAPRAGPITAVRRIWRARGPGHLSFSAGHLMTGITPGYACRGGAPTAGVRDPAAGPGFWGAASRFILSNGGNRALETAIVTSSNRSEEHTSELQ